MSTQTNIDAGREGHSRAALIERLVRSRLTRHDDPGGITESASARGAEATVTPLQRSLWLHGERCGHGNRQLLSWGARLTGDIDDAALEAALRAVATDPALRVIFPVVESELTCLPAAHGDPLIFVDRSRELARLAPSDREAVARQTMTDRADDVDIAHNVLALACVRIDASCILLGLIAHHLIFDGRSLRLFLDRLEVRYRERQSNPGRDNDIGLRPHALRPPGNAEESIAYWATALADHPPGLASARPLAPLRGGRCDVLIPAPTTRRLRRLALDRRATLFMVVFACVAVALRRAGAPSDVVIGVPVDTRRPEDLDSFGYFVNTLPFRLRWDDGAADFGTILKNARTAVTEGLAHRDAALADISASLGVSREATASIFDVALNFLADTDDELRLDGVDCEPFDLDVAQPEFGLTITVRDQGRELDIVMEYAPRFLDTSGAELLCQLLANVCDDIATDPDSAISASTFEELFRPTGASRTTLVAGQMAEHRAPKDHLQTVVAEVFADVLGATGSLTTDDDFFLLGGYSLHATRVAVDLRPRTGVTLTLADIFDNPTVGELAALIATKSGR